MFRSEKYRQDGKTWTLIDFINKAKYVVFGVTLLYKDEPLETTDEPPVILDMPELETEQQGQGLKILTPQHMLSRLPISSGQLKAGNNFEKLRNEIRQLVYSLYRSKILSKTVYNGLVNAI